MWYWAFGIESGKILQIGPKASEEAANQEAAMKFSSPDYKILPLDTRSDVEATRKYKYWRAKNGDPLSEAIERISHDKAES